MLRYDRQTKPGLVALYDIRPGNGAGPFLQPGARTGLLELKECQHLFVSSVNNTCQHVLHLTCTTYTVFHKNNNPLLNCS